MGQAPNDPWLRKTTVGSRCQCRAAPAQGSRAVVRGSGAGMRAMLAQARAGIAGYDFFTQEWART
jgi:hypothetical protein